MNIEKTKTQFISVPFKAEGSNGLTKYTGIAKFSPAGIVVEFDSKFLGFIGGEVREVQIPLDEIFDIRFRKGIYKFFAAIKIRLRNFAKVSQLPNDEGKIKLDIKREDFELAQKAVEQTLRYISKDESLALPDSDDANGQLLPAPTSVNELFDTEKLKTKNLRETDKLGKN
jgi:hypothetical protein